MVQHDYTFILACDHMLSRSSDPDMTQEVKRSTIRDALSVYVPSFFDSLGMSIVSPILPLFALSFNVDLTLTSLAISMYALGRFVADLPVGMLADRLGRKPMMLVGTLILTITALLNANARSFWEFISYRVLQGAGASMWMTSRTTLLADILRPEERGRIMGYFQTFMLVGTSAGPTIGGVVATIYGLQPTFYVYSLTGFITFLLTLIFIQEPRSLRQRHKEKSEFSLEAYKRLLSNRTYAMACLATFTIFFMTTGIRSTMIPIYSDKVLDLDAAQIGTILSYSTLMNLVLTIPVGYMLDYFGRKVMIVRSMIITAIASLILPMTGDYTQISLACLLLGIGTSGAQTGPLALATDSTINEPHGLSMSLYRLFGDLALVVGPVLLGVIADSYGLQMPFYFMTAMLCVSTALMALFARETYQRRQRKTEPKKETQV